MGSEDEILDWARRHVTESELSSQEDVQTAIEDYAYNQSRDKGKRWDIYKSKRPNWFERTSPSGTNLSEEVTDFNKDTIKQQIDDATKSTELDEISLDEIYRESTKIELNKMIDNKREELEEPIIVEIDGEEFEIPVKFQPGRPREEVRDIVAALAGETMEAIFSAETKEQVDEIEIPANIPQSIKNMLNAERKARFKEVQSEEGA